MNPSKLLQRLFAAASTLVLLLPAPAAWAVPSFARQTGAECAACHIGAYGAHLTPMGMKFKIGGYVDSDGKGTKIPLALQVTAASIKPENGPSKTRTTQIDLYVAGKLSDYLGVYSQIQHSESPGTDHFTDLHALDLRYAREIRLGDKPLTLGATLNNAPTITDPVDALPYWGWGAFGLGRDFVGTRTGSMLNQFQGGLTRRVLGVTGYGFYDNQWYGEIGTYRSLSLAAQDKLGLPAASATTVGDIGRLGGNTLYWRGAWIKDFKTQAFSIGAVGMNADLQPGPQRQGPSDRVRDIGMDATYEYLGTREHMVQLRGSWIREKRDYGTSPPNFITTAPSLPTGKLTEKTLAAIYSHSSGASLQVARTWSSASPDFGRFTVSGRPDTTITFINPYYTFFGKEDSPVPAGFNVQVGAYWLRWNKVNGQSTNVFGPFPPLDAKDFNQVALYARIAY